MLGIVCLSYPEACPLHWVLGRVRPACRRAARDACLALPRAQVKPVGVNVAPTGINVVPTLISVGPKVSIAPPATTVSGR